MKRDLWYAKHICTCGTVMKKKRVAFEGFKLRGWNCPTCDETVIHPTDAQKFLVYNQLKQGIKVRVGELGNSLIMRFPKEAAAFCQIKKGKIVTLKVDHKNRLAIIT